MSTFMQEMRNVVVVHDREHDSWAKALEFANIHAPLSIRSFTESPNNPHNAGLEQAAGEADILVIQKDLLAIPSSAANLAVNAAMRSPFPVGRILFEDDYRDHADKDISIGKGQTAEIQQESKEI